MSLKDLNRKLNEYRPASMRSYYPKDPYEAALKEIKQVNNMRAEKINQRDKKLGRKERLLPAKKV